MFESIMKFFKRTNKKEISNSSSKDTAKERLHLVLMQDRANVSADFLDLMRQEIIEVIKKYIDIDESAMDVRLTNQAKEDGTQGAPALYANIPILNIRDENKKTKKEIKEENKKIKEVDSEKKEEKNKIEERIDNTDEKQNSKDINEEKTEETNKESEEELKKQEEEKIEEAKKIVEEENSDIGDSELNDVNNNKENN